MSKYKINQINIGDKVIYKDNGCNMNWQVIGKLDKTLLSIEKNDEGAKQIKIIDITELVEVSTFLKI